MLQLAIVIALMVLAALPSSAQWITEPALIDSVLARIPWSRVEQVDLGRAVAKAILDDRRTREDSADNATIISEFASYAIDRMLPLDRALDIVHNELSSARSGDSSHCEALVRYGLPPSSCPTVIEAGRRVLARRAARPRQYVLVVAPEGPLAVLGIEGPLHRRRILSVLSDDVGDLVTRLDVDSLEASRLDRVLALEATVPGFLEPHEVSTVYRASDSLAAVVRARVLEHANAPNMARLSYFAHRLGLNGRLVDSFATWTVGYLMNTDVRPKGLRYRITSLLDAESVAYDTASLDAQMLDSLISLARTIVARRFGYPKRFYLVARGGTATPWALIGTSHDDRLLTVELHPDKARLEAVGLTPEPVRSTSDGTLEVVDGLEACRCLELVSAIREHATAGAPP